ncbi:MAG: polyprenyl synthetase family protein [Flavobacteriaceae bacterium]
MKKVEQIKQPIYAEMELFEESFEQSMSSKVALLNRITHFIVRRKGKQMRPMLVFLTAKMLADKEIPQRTYRGASVIELIHTATLVHDDVVDDSGMRRGFFSLNALWKNKIAVLVGDYLLSKGLLLSIENEDYDLLKIISEAVRQMSEGELLQIQKARSLDITESVYYEIIQKKTAILLASCCAMGAQSVYADSTIVETMHAFGMEIGMAFQIKDDLFDYTDGPIGKPTGIDIREQKMTLPLIHALNVVSENDRRWMTQIVKRHYKDKKKVRQLIQKVKEVGGLSYAETQMQKHHSAAKKLLADFPQSSARDAMAELVDYVIERKI